VSWVRVEGEGFLVELPYADDDALTVLMALADLESGRCPTCATRLERGKDEQDAGWARCPITDWWWRLRRGEDGHPRIERRTCVRAVAMRVEPLP
jgi:hypothetical protein